MRITIETIENVYKAQKFDVETLELRGYELIERLFVDSSGLGAPDEPALTQGKLKARLSELLKEHGQLDAFIIGAGQFQVYVGLFKKTSKPSIEYITPYAFKRLENGRVIIRLWDTDILDIEYGGDSRHAIKLDSGGFRTKTTKRYINRYLPSPLSVYQKDFDWFVHNSNTGETIPFEDGLTLTI